MCLTRDWTRGRPLGDHDGSAQHARVDMRDSGPTSDIVVQSLRRVRFSNPRRSLCLILALIVAAMTLASCAGDGTKILDVAEPAGPFPARFSAIHRHVLGPTCSPECHEPGGIAPFSMRTADEAY